MSAFRTDIDPKVAREDVGVHVMMALVRDAIDALAQSTASTLNGLLSDYDAVARRHEAVRAGAEMLRARLMDCAKGRQSGAELRDAMVDSCQQYLNRAAKMNDATVNYVLPFIRDTSVVVAFGAGPLMSYCVASSIALRTGVRFLIPDGLPQGLGESLVQSVRREPALAQLEQQIGTADFEQLYARSVTTIPDGAVAALMADADFVMCGATAVTEHGGLVHTTGSHQLALIAHAMTKPFYVLAESFKFTAVFPISTTDLYVDSSQHRRGLRSALSASILPDPVETPTSATSPGSTPTRGSRLPVVRSFGAVSSLDADAPATRAPVKLFPVELVPPKLVTLLFCEDGIMPPSAVADQMLIAKRAAAGGSA